MDELLLENSICKNQAEYDAIVKDKNNVADIFFINFVGFISMFKIGLRGEMKRYKAEEASLFPKYINLDNKDVSLAVKMLFDARVSHGAVTARMTKLLAKIKGNMLDPKDIDNDMMKELVIDSKITTVHKPSMKVRAVMNKWLDDECTIEWVAYYLYKIARLPEYKDFTKEFVSAYKTGQYGQAYNNILIGARKKHTGNVPKELQDNNPTALANTTTPSQSQQLPTDDTTQPTTATNTVSKDDFMALFKKAIDDLKAQTPPTAVVTAPVDDVQPTPVTNTTPTDQLPKDTTPADVVNTIDADTTSTADAEANDKLDVLDTVVNQQIDDQGDTHTKVELDTVDHVNDVPVENNTDYDKMPDQHHDPATVVEPDNIEVSFREALDKFILVSNNARLEFVQPNKKIIINNLNDDYNTRGVWLDNARLDICSSIFNKIKDTDISTRKANFISFMNSIEKALTEFEYGIGNVVNISSFIDSDDIQSVMFNWLTHKQVQTMDGEYLFTDKSFRQKMIYNLSRKQYDWLTNISYSPYGFADATNEQAGQYFYKLLQSVADGSIPFDLDMMKITFDSIATMVSDRKKFYYSFNTSTTSNSLIWDMTNFYSDGNERLISVILDLFISEIMTFEELKQVDLHKHLTQNPNIVGVKFILRDLGLDNAMLLNEEFKPVFEKYCDKASAIYNRGEINLKDGHKIYTDINLVPVKEDGNVWINGFDSAKDGGGTISYGTLNKLIFNGWVTQQTPNGLSREHFSPELVNTFVEYNKAINNLSSYDRVDEHADKLFTRTISSIIRGEDETLGIDTNKPKHKIEAVFFFNKFFDSIEDGFNKLAEVQITGRDNDKKLMRVKLVALMNIYDRIDILHDFGLYQEVRKIAEQKMVEITTVEDIKNLEIEDKRRAQDVGDNFDQIIRLTDYEKVGDTIIEYIESDINVARKFFGKKSSFIISASQYKSGAVRQRYNRLPDRIYQSGLTLFKSGEILVNELNDQMLWELFSRGDLTDSEINEYLSNHIQTDESWLKFEAGDVNEHIFGGLDILTFAIANNRDIDKSIVNKILENIEKSVEQGKITTRHGMPFIKAMCATKDIGNVIPNDTYDRMINIASKAVSVNRYASTGIYTNLEYLMTVCQIKNKTVLEECDTRFRNTYNYSAVDFEIRDKQQFELIYNVDKFKHQDLDSQKHVILTLLREFNRKKQSSWMQSEGRELYLEKILELMGVSASIFGEDEMDSVISLTRMKTMLVNSTIHNVDYDKMQADLNSGLINTPKTIKRDVLMKLAKLNGVGSLSKEQVKFPRGTRTIDVVRHMRGEISLMDKVEVKLVDVPYEEVEHTEESLKRVNATMWKTRNKHHKNHMPIFEKEFRPLNKTNNVDTFLAENPDTKVLELAFHGTGRIAGAFICRYGFADVRGDVGIGIAGKALGNGIYVAVHYNKSGIYATDNGVAYHAGLHDGYMFRLRVALGKRGVHHQYGGPEAPMFWDAPEWCVKFPTQQIDILSIYKMHSVKRSDAHKILGDYT